MGYFDNTAGNDTTGNAAKDFADLNAANPGQFSNSIFDRLFGGKSKKEVQQAALASSAATPDVPVTDSANPAKPAAPPATSIASDPSDPTHNSSLSSGSGLVRRILGQVMGPPTHNDKGEGLVPGTPFTTPQFVEQLKKLMMPDPSGVANAPFNVPQFPNPQPPQRVQPSPYGNQTHGGAIFGGATFGGQQFGQSAPAPAPAPAPPIQGPAVGPLIGNGMGMGAPVVGNLPVPPRPQMPTNQGYFRGGALRLMRGGYPANLMMGLPERHASGGVQHAGPHMGGQQGAVPLDGQGDGRSDHVDAKLSPGEFVNDAETVALMGNGDSEAGARGMEAIRQEIRKAKGKALAKGKFSPDAKKPGYYAKVGMKAARGHA